MLAFNPNDIDLKTWTRLILALNPKPSTILENLSSLGCRDSHEFLEREEVVTPNHARFAPLRGVVIFSFDRLRINWGAARAEDGQGSPTQSHISPSILVYEDSTISHFLGCRDFTNFSRAKKTSSPMTGFSRHCADFGLENISRGVDFPMV